MTGLNKIFEKKSANKPIALAIFYLSVALLFFLFTGIKSGPNKFESKSILLFFILNSLHLVFLDYIFSKLDLDKNNFFFLPLTFVGNLYIFVWTQGVFFLFLQLVFIWIFFILLRNQNTEKIKNDIFHIATIIVVMSLINVSGMSLFIPLILMLIFFNINPKKNLLIIAVSSILVFFFMYSIIFFTEKFFPQLKIFSPSLNSIHLEFRSSFNLENHLMALCYIISLYEFPKIQTRASLFKKSLFLFISIFSFLDILANIFIENYIFGMSVPMLMYFYSNFIYFRKKPLVREVFFSGFLILLLILTFIKL